MNRLTIIYKKQKAKNKKQKTKNKKQKILPRYCVARFFVLCTILNFQIVLCTILNFQTVLCAILNFQAINF